MDAQFQIITLTTQDLDSIIEKTAEASLQKAIGYLENRLIQQKNHYEELLDAQTVSHELKCSVDSVYRYWREGSLKHGQIKPSEKGSTRAQIAEFRQNLNQRRE